MDEKQQEIVDAAIRDVLLEAIGKLQLDNRAATDFLNRAKHHWPTYPADRYAEIKRQVEIQQMTNRNAMKMLRSLMPKRFLGKLPTTPVQEE